jgi:hypothetical protein
VDASVWTNAVTWGACTAALGFAAMVSVMIYSKRFEPAGSLIVLRTTMYIVLAGLAMMILGFSYMVVTGFLTE